MEANDSVRFRIVSGGQTGVDRGALDAALDAGIAIGGWCPADGQAEDGPVPARYGLRPAPQPGYRERTIRNVVDSDGTLILYRADLSGGTEATLRACLDIGRPYRLVDAGETRPDRAGNLAGAFVASRGIRTLNVAGPRASGWPGGHDYAYRAIEAMLRLLGPAPPEP